MEKNLFAVKAQVDYEYDDVISLWTTEAEAKRELKNVKRLAANQWVNKFYIVEVRVNNREMFKE